VAVFSRTVLLEEKYHLILVVAGETVQIKVEPTRGVPLMVAEGVAAAGCTGFAQADT
jgi:hypothetical protein